MYYGRRDGLVRGEVYDGGNIFRPISSFITNDSSHASSDRTNHRTGCRSAFYSIRKLLTALSQICVGLS